MIEKTLVLIKPDAVEAGHVGHIISRYEEAGLKLLALEQRTIDADFADQHYAEHVGRDFYPPVREFVTSGPLVALVLAGEGAIAAVRELHGATDPAQAAPGTVRADYATSIRHNAVHASDATSSAAREIELWFPGL